MRLNRETFDHWCGRLTLAVTYTGIAVFTGFIAILWGIE